jgi:hypothetical protein
LAVKFSITNDHNELISVVITVNPLPEQTLTVIGDNDGNVYRPTTASVSLSITSAIRRLGGSLVFEAYDARGNSVFSSPINVEAL